MEGAMYMPETNQHFFFSFDVIFVHTQMFKFRRSSVRCMQHGISSENNRDEIQQNNMFQQMRLFDSAHRRPPAVCACPQMLVTRHWCVQSVSNFEVWCFFTSSPPAYPFFLPFILLAFSRCISPALRRHRHRCSGRSMDVTSVVACLM